jgi:hypothetical protein
LRFDREPLHGFVQSPGFQTDSGVEFLSQDGNLAVIPYPDVKAICFVQDFDDPLPRLDGAHFASRPKKAGLWVRLRFRDGASMDALLTGSLLQLDPHGYTLSPPDQGVNPQRLFIPRAALTDLHVLAVVGGRVKKPAPAPVPAAQAKLF